MNKMILALIVSLACTSAAANEDCAVVHEFGELMMTSRQAGMPMATVVKSLSDMGEFVQLSIAAAYSEPIYGDESLRQQAVDRFAAGVYAQCVRNGFADKNSGSAYK